MNQVMSSCFWRNLPSAFSQVELIFPNTLSSQYLLFPMHLTLLNFRFPKDVNTVRKRRIAAGFFVCFLSYRDYYLSPSCTAFITPRYRGSSSFSPLMLGQISWQKAGEKMAGKVKRRLSRKAVAVAMRTEAWQEIHYFTLPEHQI